MPSPNTLEFRREAVRLADATRPGRLRYLTLELVDPHYRVCSTRNVPPQRHDWWAEAALAKVDWTTRGVPAELVAEIASRLDEWPMGDEEAEALRAEFALDKECFDAIWTNWAKRSDYIWGYTGMG